MASGLGLLENRPLTDSPEKNPLSAAFASRTSHAFAGRVGGEKGNDSPRSSVQGNISVIDGNIEGGAKGREIRAIKWFLIIDRFDVDPF